MHYVYGVADGKFDPADVLLYAFFIYLVLILGVNFEFLSRQLGKIPLVGAMMQMASSFTVKENLDNYWRTLDDDDRKWTIEEEKNLRRNLNMKCMSQDSLKAANENIMGRSHLANIHCYNILRHPKYVSAFQYVPANVADRDKFINDKFSHEQDGHKVYQSDLVKMVLNLAYKTQEQIKEFHFSKEHHKDLTETRNQ